MLAEIGNGFFETAKLGFAQFAVAIGVEIREDFLRTALRFSRWCIGGRGGRRGRGGFLRSDFRWFWACGLSLGSAF